MEGKIVETVFTFSVEGILSKVASLAAQELSLAWGFKAEIRKLQKSLTNIERFLVDVADQPQDRPKSIEDWVKKLKDVAHDAEDVLDEFQYEVDRRKVEIQNHMKKKVLNSFSLSNPLAFRLQMAHKIQKINASLVDLKSEASLLGLVSKNKDATPQGIRWDRQTNAFIGKDEIIIGRQDDVSKIVATLTDSKYNQENLAVMAIVGMGGLGKTTLAKSVYNEDSIDKFFEKKIWICVSDTFDVNFILLQILESLNSAKAPSKDNQNAILTNLQVELKDKRYLLVLDDVWNEDTGKWENLMEGLSKLNSSGGSKIIVTTRSGKVASISQKLLPPHELGKLSMDECWSIMKDRVFPYSAHIAPEFQKIGVEIAKTCDGVPLVAKVLGGILHTKKSIEEWWSFKNNRIWNSLLKGEDKIMLVLRLSFDNLKSPSLKQCFAYCSIFKKDFEIQRDNLIQLWMAQGLLRPSPGESKDMEDIGNEYFDILLQSSLFQDATMDYQGIISTCKMHNLVHELAELVSKSESLMGDLRVIDNILEIRHVAQVSTSALERIPTRTVVKLRSLFSKDGEDPSNILPQFKALRVLNLNNANIEELPVSVGRLKHLRYLDISQTRFKALPNSIGKLYNLQTLRATDCALKEFPKELQNMINLRHIYFGKSTKYPHGINRLTCLRTLPYFSVGNEIGCRIEELAGLKQLKGELIVCNLEHVKNGDEATKAKLEDKMKISHLRFLWTEDRPTTDTNEEEDVLEGLRPHPELQSLSIENFMGVKFPSWMMSRLHNHLKKIQLIECNKCEVVPPLGHLPNLTELQIIRMANLKCVGAEFYGYDLVHNETTTSEDTITLFPELEVLHISECGELNEWMEAPMMSAIMVFPCLERLYIRNCEKLRHLPDGLNTLPLLEELTIEKCPSLESIPIKQGMASLRKLEINGCERLSSLPSGLDYCTSLRELNISNCDGLSGALSGLQCCTSLEKLHILHCKNLTSVDIKGSLTSLQILNIGDCYNLSRLQSLPQQFPALRELYLWRCPMLSSLGYSLESNSLKVLKIEDCERLKSEITTSHLTEINILERASVEILSWHEPKSLATGLQWSLATALHWYTGLKELRIGGFSEELDSFPDFHAGSLMHLTKLRLVGWPKLRSLPQQIQQLTFLTDLEINSFEGMETLPEWLGSLTSLTELKIEDCKNLMNLPSVQAMQRLTKLQTLSINKCHTLLKQRCRKDSGTDWPKISHIPHISIED